MPVTSSSINTVVLHEKDKSTYLLVDVTITRAPAKDLVVTARPVNGGLRVDSQETELIHLGQLASDGGRLRQKSLVRPRKGRQFVLTEFGEELGDVCGGFRVAPQLESILFLHSAVRTEVTCRKNRATKLTVCLIHTP